MPLRNSAGNPPDAHLSVLQPLLRSRASSPVSQLHHRSSLFSSIFFFCTPNRDARCSIEDSGTDHTRGCSRNVREERRREPPTDVEINRRYLCADFLEGAEPVGQNHASSKEEIPWRIATSPRSLLSPSNKSENRDSDRELFRAESSFFRGGCLLFRAISNCLKRGRRYMIFISPLLDSPLLCPLSPSAFLPSIRRDRVHLLTMHRRGAKITDQSARGPNPRAEDVAGRWAHRGGDLFSCDLLKFASRNFGRQSFPSYSGASKITSGARGEAAVQRRPITNVIERHVT